MTDYIELDAPRVAIAATLILLNGGVSVLLRLGLERRLLIASVRTVVQLLLIGFVLDWVFGLDRATVVLALMIVMVLIAGHTAVGRSKRRYPGITFNSLVSMWASSWLVTGIALVAVFRNQPWYQAQYAIPLLGMILGNTLNGISLGLDRLTETLATRRDETELLLTLGGTRWEASRPAVREAVRTGMIPIINSMMIVGLVSLPGMMTGQLIAGVEPIQAVRYQIVIMFFIASGTALGTFGVVLLSIPRLFNTRHQFLYRRIVKRGE